MVVLPEEAFLTSCKAFEDTHEKIRPKEYEKGGEGMVIRPLDFIARGKKDLVQPAIKCRGKEYLRIIQLNNRLIALMEIDVHILSATW